MRRSHLVVLLKTRSLLLSFATVVPLVVVILGLAACVKHPVGDPEKSKVDPKFSGVWLTEETDGQGSFLVLRPYDARTYFAKIMSYRRDDGAIQPTEQMDCKAWLTTIGEATFITMEPLSSAHFAGVAEEPPYLVGRISLADGALHLRLVDGGKEPASSADNSGELQAAIAEDVNSAALYVDETTIFEKTDDKTTLRSVLEAFHQSN